MEKILSTEYTIRFSDCDPFGHLNNARYIDYFLNAREDHLKKYYDFELVRYAHLALSWVVNSHEIIYVRPAAYNEQVVIRSSLLKATSSSVHVEMIMMNAGTTQVKALMWTKFTIVNLKTGKKANHPEEFMEFADPLQMEEDLFLNGINERIKVLKREFPG